MSFSVELGVRLVCGRSPGVGLNAVLLVFSGDLSGDEGRLSDLVGEPDLEI